MESSTEENPQLKLSRLEAFKVTREKYAMMGISPKLMTQSYPVNRTILSYFLILGTAITFISVYIFKYAESFFEFIQSIYIVSAAFLVVFALFFLIFQVEKFFEYINRCEAMLNSCRL